MLEPTVPFAPAPQRLDNRGTYPCPVCRLGQISPITLMETLGCNTCHHIYTLNRSQQCLTVADMSPAKHWYWDGRRWFMTYRQDIEIGGWIWLLAIGFVLLPALLIGIAAYIFPPLPDSQLVWFPILWTGLTFFFHLACAVWLIGESLQFPFRAMLRSGRFFGIGHSMFSGR
jgi:hypothetical protein